MRDRSKKKRDLSVKKSIVRGHRSGSISPVGQATEVIVPREKTNRPVVFLEPLNSIKSPNPTIRVPIKKTNAYSYSHISKGGRNKDFLKDNGTIM